MNLLIIDDNTKRSLRDLREYAERNPYTMDDLLDVYNKQAPVPGDIKEFCREVPVGYKVVFTIELQKYKVRHMSMSCLAGTPHPEAVRQVMQHLGFSGDVQNCHITFENDHRAVNVIEKI